MLLIELMFAPLAGAGELELLPTLAPAPVLPLPAAAKPVPGTAPPGSTVAAAPSIVASPGFTAPDHEPTAARSVHVLQPLAAAWARPISLARAGQRGYAAPTRSSAAVEAVRSMLRGSKEQLVFACCHIAMCMQPRGSL